MKPALIMFGKVHQVWPSWDKVPKLHAKMRALIVEVDDDAVSGWTFVDGKAIRPKLHKDKKPGYWRVEEELVKKVEEKCNTDVMWSRMMRVMSELTDVPKEEIIKKMCRMQGK